MAAFGFSAEAVAAARSDAASRAPEEAFVIHPENGVAMRLLLAMQTQWRRVGLSTMSRAEMVATGLDYGVLEQTARFEGLKMELPADFRRLRIAEAEMLTAWGEDRRRAK